MSGCVRGEGQRQAAAIGAAGQVGLWHGRTAALALELRLALLNAVQCMRGVFSPAAAAAGTSRGRSAARTARAAHGASPPPIRCARVRANVHTPRSHHRRPSHQHTGDIGPVRSCLPKQRTFLSVVCTATSSCGPSLVQHERLPSASSAACSLLESEAPRLTACKEPPEAPTAAAAP